MVNQPIDSDGTSLLHLAANSDNPSIPQLLVDSHANVDCQNSDGWTPLHVAVVNGCTQALQVLLENGANTHLLDQDDMTPLDHAQEEEQWWCLDILERFDQKREELVILEEISMCELYVSMVMGDDEETVATVTAVDHTHTLLPSNEDQNVICTSDLPGSPRENLIGQFDRLTCSNQSLIIVESNDALIDNTSTGIDDSQQLCTDTTADYITAIEESITSFAGCKSFHEQSNECLTNIQLRQKLVELGEEPGPVNDHTRSAYLKYLDKLQKGIQPAGNKGYKGQLYTYQLSLQPVTALLNHIYYYPQVPQITKIELYSN